MQDAALQVAVDCTALFYYSLSCSTTCNNSNVQLNRCYYFRKLCMEARPLTYHARLMARPRRGFFFFFFFFFFGLLLGWEGRVEERGARE
ncbi:hypothetical protein I7I50_07242 [Histoplasma capsulatum G186AR]|uniref:Uncharacterized protein n=1 Tax=Ajellomyces capsulatus TaxID=5037 RepID=A0A8H8D4E3_AJECA|nr:hypothetical protein I7I52_09686 [Histoplasma capsulatum]QSS67991.1 hypothetical protein I7I50_07242 [Histoplasma capsulatum G186AR]